MEDRFWKITGFWAMGLLLFISTMIIIHWVVGFANWSTLSAADLGTWAGAIGTVATLIGTIRLARQETKRRHRQERDAAVIAAGFMDLSLLTYRDTLSRVIQGLKIPVKDGAPVAYPVFAHQLKMCPTWTREELNPLLYLDNHAAANLAIAQSLVRDTAERLSTAASAQDEFMLDLLDKSELNQEVVDVLEDALRRVDTCFDRCSALLEDARLV
jgi:hypothetical protein